MAIRFLDNIPIANAIEIAIIFGSLKSTIDPSWLKKMEGKIMDGKTADGT